MKKFLKSIMNKGSFASNNKTISIKLIEIVKILFDRAGFQQPSFENEAFLNLITMNCSPIFIKDMSMGLEEKKHRQTGLYGSMIHNMNILLTADKAEVEKFNRNASEFQKQEFFISCLSLLLLHSIDYKCIQ